MKYSLIIPVYNVQDYIEQCLLSVINQTISKDKYEVIVVNDGTKDNSMEIVNRIDWKGTSYRIIDQTNQGLSAARNTGLSVAKGDYIWFIDSDDWIETDSISIIDKYLSDNIDVLSQRSFFVNIGDKQDVKVYKGDASNGQDFTSQPYKACAQFYIYKKSFLGNNSLKFKVGIFHEDAQFNPRALYLAKNIKCFWEPLYHHRMREGSITTTPNPKRVVDLMVIFDDLYNFQKEVVDKKYFDDWGRDTLSGTLLSILYLARLTNDKSLNKIVKSFVNRSICIYSLQIARNQKSRILGLLSKILGNNVYLAYGILYKIRY